MTKQLQKYDVPFERFSGVDGSKLAADAQLYHQSNLRSHLSTAEIGCLLSHLGVWQTFLKTDSDYALIFEDDVHFAADFSVFLKRLRGILDPSEANVHRLEAFNARITVERGITAKIGDRFCRKMISNQGGAAAYVLNRRTAERLVSMKSQMRHLPDTEMFDPTRRATLGLAIYQWLPAPCIQDMLHDERIGLASALAGTRSDERLGILKSPNTISEPLRRLFRPAYTFFYDLLLWPRGLSRKDSKFG